jgi:hypothetical protein
MKKFAFPLMLALLVGCSAPGGKVYMNELGSATWVEKAGGNTLEYSFTADKMNVNINGKTTWAYTIAKIDDGKRMFVIYAEKSKKYVPVWWLAPANDSVQLTPLVGVKASDSLKDAEATPCGTKFSTLKKK